VDQNFVSILEKLIKERGKEVLLDKSKCKAFLSDYTRNEYKNESDLLFLAIEAGSAKAINDTEELRICKLQQIRKLHENKFLAPEFSIDVVDTLALVLRGSTTRTEPIKVESTRIESVRVESTKVMPSGFVRINGGTFLMGSPLNEPERYSNEVQHQVTVSSLYVGKYEVTQTEYQAVMGTNPSDFKGYNLPVENISWYDAVEYCNRLSQREGLTPAYQISGTNVTCDWNANGYRLPTEAEWEYACRAGTTTAYNTGNTISTNTGWYKDNSNSATHPVGQKSANVWDLYDMHGNVWEWCWDWYDKYSSIEQTNPRGPSSGSSRVLRGGSWFIYGRDLRSAYRNYSSPFGRSNNIGFRLVRS
jgi:formylglycine-generating enzyme required for sulfatase activity